MGMRTELRKKEKFPKYSGLVERQDTFSDVKLALDIYFLKQELRSLSLPVHPWKKAW